MRPTAVDSQAIRSPPLSPPPLQLLQQTDCYHHHQHSYRQRDEEQGYYQQETPEEKRQCPILTEDILPIPSHVRNMSQTTTPKTSLPSSRRPATETGPLSVHRSSSTNLAALLLATTDIHHPRHFPQEHGEKTLHTAKHPPQHQRKQQQESGEQQQQRGKSEEAIAAHRNQQDQRSYDSHPRFLSHYHSHYLHRSLQPADLFSHHQQQHTHLQRQYLQQAPSYSSLSLSPPIPRPSITTRSNLLPVFATSECATFDPTELYPSPMPVVRKQLSTPLQQQRCSSAAATFPRRGSSVGREEHTTVVMYHRPSATGSTSVASTVKYDDITITASSSSQHHTLGHQSEPESEGSARTGPLQRSGMKGSAPRPRSASSCSSGNIGIGNTCSSGSGVGAPPHPGRAGGADDSVTKGKVTNLNGQVTSDPSQHAIFVQPPESTSAALTAMTLGGGTTSYSLQQQQHQQQQQHRQASIDRNNNGGYSDHGNSNSSSNSSVVGSRPSVTVLARSNSPAVHPEVLVNNSAVSSTTSGPDRGWSHLNEFLMALMSQSLASRVFARRPQLSSVGSTTWSLVRVLNTGHLLYLFPVTTITITRLLTTEYICDEQLFSWLTVQAVLFVAQIFSACHMLQRQAMSSRLALLDQRSRVLMIVFMIWTVLGVGFLSGNSRTTCPRTEDPVYNLSFKIIIFHLAMIGFYFLPCSSLVLQRVLPASATSELSRTATKPMLESLDSRPMTEGMFGEDPDEATCAICLGEYQPKEAIRFLPCQHHFHQECVDQWLLTDKSCPLCKHDIDRPIPVGHLRRQSTQDQLAFGSTAMAQPSSLPTEVASSSFEMQFFLPSMSSSSSASSFQQPQATLPSVMQQQHQASLQDGNILSHVTPSQSVGESQTLHVIVL